MAESSNENTSKRIGNLFKKVFEKEECDCGKIRIEEIEEEDKESKEASEKK